VAYCLKPGRPVGCEVRRVGEKQCELALAALHGVGTPARDKSTYRARWHIKKIGPLHHLFQPSLAQSCRPVNRRLRPVSRLLAPIADGEAVVDTLARICSTRRSRDAVSSTRSNFAFRSARNSSWTRPGLKRSVRPTRRAMALTLEHPTDAHHHLWRRRVQDLWQQVRLLQARCGGQLAREDAELERAMTARPAWQRPA
jgi:hypothetical protein